MRRQPEIAPYAGEQFPAGQDTESGGQRARGYSAKVKAPKEGQRVGRSVPAGGKAPGRRSIGSRELQRAGRDQAGWSSQGDFFEEEEGVGRLLEAARLQGAASPGAPPPRSGPQSRPAQAGHSSPVPRTRKGRRAQPPPGPPSQTWCPGRCRE